MSQGDAVDQGVRQHVWFACDHPNCRKSRLIAYDSVESLRDDQFSSDHVGRWKSWLHPDVVLRRYEDFVFSHGDPVADPNFGDGMQEQSVSLEELVEELVDDMAPCDDPDDPDDEDAEERSAVSDDSSIDPEGQRRNGDSTPILPERIPRVRPCLRGQVSLKIFCKVLL